MNLDPPKDARNTSGSETRALSLALAPLAHPTESLSAGLAVWSKLSSWMISHAKSTSATWRHPWSLSSPAKLVQREAHSDFKLTRRSPPPPTPPTPLRPHHAQPRRPSGSPSRSAATSPLKPGRSRCRARDVHLPGFAVKSSTPTRLDAPRRGRVARVPRRRRRDDAPAPRAGAGRRRGSQGRRPRLLGGRLVAPACSPPTHRACHRSRDRALWPMILRKGRSASDARDGFCARR